MMKKENNKGDEEGDISVWKRVIISLSLFHSIFFFFFSPLQILHAYHPTMKLGQSRIMIKIHILDFSFIDEKKERERDVFQNKHKE